MKKILIIGLVAGFICLKACCAQETADIQLPDPDMKGGRPLMEVLKDRKTERDFSPNPLPIQTLSDLLWAAFGINRPESDHRTAPSAMNCQEIDVYVAMQSGLYLYDPKNNILVRVLDQDIRVETGKQAFVSEAPVNLIFVADLTRAAKFGDKAMFYAACDTGYISENVYLFCASKGLATVVRGMFDEQNLANAMKLTQGKKIILTQTVGYRK